MNRLAIMTVGKTHSGKTTFAKLLEKKLPNSIVVDQDNHAEILHTYYPALIPKQGPNTIKFALTRTVVDYAVNETNCHIILCNSNRSPEGRLKLLKYYQDKSFTTILVHFDVPDRVLEERIKLSHRNNAILRTVSSFKEVLAQQKNDDLIGPMENEADHFLIIKDADDMKRVISGIIEMNQY